MVDTHQRKIQRYLKGILFSVVSRFSRYAANVKFSSSERTNEANLKPGYNYEIGDVIIRRDLGFKYDIMH